MDKTTVTYNVDNYPLQVRAGNLEASEVLPFGECVSHWLVSQGLTSQLYSYYEEVEKAYFHWDGDATLTLSAKPEPSFTGVPLAHFQPCPMALIKAGTNSREGMATNQCIRVAVACLIECCGMVLITRRSPTMRTFPGVWVLPGGHVDKGETLEQAVRREVEEETGVVNELAHATPLIMWESVFPQRVEWGPPQRQHLIVYYRIVLDLPSPPPIQMKDGEVDGYAWLPLEVVRAAVAANTAPSPNSAVERESPATQLEEETLEITERVDEHTTRSAKINGGALGHLTREKGRLSTATLYVLDRWQRAVLAGSTPV